MKQLLQFVRSLDRSRAFETSRTLFGIMGAAGYAGYLAAMHILLAVFSVGLLSVVWFAIYYHLEVRP